MFTLPYFVFFLFGSTELGSNLNKLFEKKVSIFQRDPITFKAYAGLTSIHNADLAMREVKVRELKKDGFSYYYQTRALPRDTLLTV